jgi:thiamine transport system ATP-binding protein
LRDQLLGQLPEVFAGVGCGVLYVTHDQDEALTLADRVAVMRAGRLHQVAAPEVLWRRPADEFVARFLGMHQIVDADVDAGVADTVFGRIPVGDAPHGPARLLVLPDALQVADGPDDGRPGLDGVVVRRRFAAERSLLVVAAADGEWEVPAPPTTPDHRPGAPVRLRLDPGRLHLLPRSTRPGDDLA